jgi:hypothetical protein
VLVPTAPTGKLGGCLLPPEASFALNFALMRRSKEQKSPVENVC